MMSGMCSLIDLPPLLKVRFMKEQVPSINIQGCGERSKLHHSILSRVMRFPRETQCSYALPRLPQNRLFYLN